MSKMGDLSIDFVVNDQDFSIKVKNADRLLRQITGQFERTTKSANRFDRGFGGALAKLRDFSVTAAAIKFTLADLDNLFLTLPKKILKTTGEFERLQKLMEGMSTAIDPGERIKEANDNMNAVIDTARNAPFAVNALADTFVKLKAGGVDPLNGSMQALVDSVAKFGGDSEMLRRAAVAVQQMGGKGVISMEELRQQLGEAVPDAMRTMAQSMGLSMGELVDRISKGQVVAVPALQKMFAMMQIVNNGAAARMMETWTGTLSRLETEWSLWQKEVGDAGFAAGVKEQLDQLTASFNSPDGRRWAREIGVALADVVEKLAKIGNFIREHHVLLGNMVGVLAAAYAGNKVFKAVSAIAVANRKASADAIASIQKERSARMAVAHLKSAQAIEDAQHAQQAVAQNAAKITAIQAQEVKHQHWVTRQRRLQAVNAARENILLAKGISPMSNKKYRDTYFAAGHAGVSAQLAKQGLAKSAGELRALQENERALKRNAEAAAMNAVAMGNVAEKSRRAAQNIGVMARAGVAARTAFNLMGGWIGLVTTLLTAGAYAWARWGSSGEKEIERVRKAINAGTVTQDDMGSAAKERGEKQKELARLNAELQLAQTDPKKYFQGRSRGGAAISDAEAEAMLRDLRGQVFEAAKEIGNFTDAISEGYEKISEVAQDEGRRRASEEVNKKLQLSDEETARSIAELQADQDRQIKAMREAGKSSEEIAELTNGLNAKIQEEARKGAEAGLKIAEELRLAAVESLREIARGMIEGSATREQFDGAKSYLAEVAKLATAQRDRVVALSSDNEYLGGKGKGKGGKENPILTEIERAKAAIETAQIRMDDLRDGVITLDRIRASVIAKIQGEIAQGKYGKGAKRPALEDANIQLLAQQRMLQAQAEITARIFDSVGDMSRDLDKEKLEALKHLFDADAKLFSGGAIGEAQRQLAQLAQQLEHTPEGLEQFKKAAESLIPKAALRDMADMGVEMRELSEEMNLSMMRPQERIQTVYEKTVREATLRFSKIKQLIGQNVKDEQQAAEAIKVAQAELNEYLQTLNLNRAYEQRSQLAQMIEDWNDSAEQARSITAGLANDAIDSLTHFMTTGEFKWREFLANLGTEVVRSSLQSTFANLFKSLEGADGAGGFTGLLTKMFSAMRPGGAGQAATQEAAAAGLTQSFDLMKDNVVVSAQAIKDLGGESQIMTSLQGMLSTQMRVTGMTTEQSLMTLSTAAQAAAMALAQISMGGGGGNPIIGALMDGIFGAVGNVGGLKGLGDVGGASLGDSMGSAANFIPKFSHAFEKGGVMTEFGPVALRKYAKGGIAKSPQLALFGEGSHNEAYVPLPDGRRIPVALEGAGASANISQDQVNINIVVNEAEGSSTTDATGAQDRVSAMKGLAKDIEGLVRATIVKEKRTGGLLSR